LAGGVWGVGARVGPGQGVTLPWSLSTKKKLGAMKNKVAKTGQQNGLRGPPQESAQKNEGNVKEKKGPRKVPHAQTDKKKKQNAQNQLVARARKQVGVTWSRKDNRAETPN